MNSHPADRPRHLVLVPGDQLDGKSAAFDGFDAAWMAEVAAPALRHQIMVLKHPG